MSRTSRGRRAPLHGGVAHAHICFVDDGTPGDCTLEEKFALRSCLMSIHALAWMSISAPFKRDQVDTVLESRSGYPDLTHARRGHDKQQRYQGPPGGFARGVALRTNSVSCEGKGIHAASRRAEPAAARTPVGEGGQAVCLRWAQREGDVGRALRKQEPARRLSLYVPTRG